MLGQPDRTIWIWHSSSELQQDHGGLQKSYATTESLRRHSVVLCVLQYSTFNTVLLVKSKFISEELAPAHPNQTDLLALNMFYNFPEHIYWISQTYMYQERSTTSHPASRLDFKPNPYNNNTDQINNGIPIQILHPFPRQNTDQIGKSTRARIEIDTNSRGFDTYHGFERLGV